jgi:hypothetical protein
MCKTLEDNAAELRDVKGDFVSPLARTLHS